MQRRPWAVLNRFFALASMLHLSGSDLESMSEFYDNFFLRAVTLIIRALGSLTQLVLAPKKVLLVEGVHSF